MPKLGDHGSIVFDFQKMLKERGYDPGPIDGIYGTKTEAAYQASIKVGAPKLVKLVEGTLEWYRAAYQLMKFDPGFEAAIARTCKTILNGRPYYDAVERATGIPWWVIGGIHWKEATCSFDAILHNGQKGIIGAKAMQQGHKSTIVPVGVGPFPDWNTAAIHAIQMNSARWAKIRAGSTDVGVLLWAVERFNGTGYISGAGREDTSPYLWDMTTINDGFGRYVQDGEYDSEARGNQSAGFAAIVKYLEQNNIISLKSAA